MMTDDITKAGILLNAVNASNKIFSKLCDNYGPDGLWHSELLWQELGLTGRMKERLSRFLCDEWAEKEIERTENFDARFITSKSNDYPSKLFDLAKPPIGLYIKGSVNISLPSIAIVGTRKCSNYARNVASNLGKALARKGKMTISGGAKGIDTAGHQGSLSENGITIVVFGTGIDEVYPVENKDLFMRILERGAWVSEYPFGTRGNNWHFPERDRIIAAMSSCIVVAESPEDGGAMHTARGGLEIKRDVWSIPGRITDEASRGTNLLIREGTNIFVSIDDFLNTIIPEHEQICLNFNDNDDHNSVNDRQVHELSDDEKVIYSLIQRNGGITADDLLIESSLDFVTVQMALINLESEGLIAGSSGRYSALLC